SGIIRNEHCRKIKIGGPGPMERPLHSPPSADLLDRYALDVLVVLVVDIARIVERWRNLVAESGRPSRKRRHKVALVGDARVHFHYIAVVETECLADRQILIGVLERNCGWSTLMTLHR